MHRNQNSSKAYSINSDGRSVEAFLKTNRLCNCSFGISTNLYRGSESARAGVTDISLFVRKHWSVLFSDINQKEMCYNLSSKKAISLLNALIWSLICSVIFFSPCVLMFSSFSFLKYIGSRCEKVHFICTAQKGDSFLKHRSNTFPIWQPMDFSVKEQGVTLRPHR